MHSYSHVNANYRVAPFAIGTNGKVRGTHIDSRRGRVVGPAGIVALLRSIDRSAYQSIGRFVTPIDPGDRSGIVTRVVAFCHAPTIFHPPDLSRQIYFGRINPRFHRWSHQFIKSLGYKRNQALTSHRSKVIFSFAMCLIRYSYD